MITIVALLVAYASGVMVFYVLELTRPLDGLPCKQYEYLFITALLWPLVVVWHMVQYIKEYKR